MIHSAAYSLKVLQQITNVMLENYAFILSAKSFNTQVSDEVSKTPWSNSLAQECLAVGVFINWCFRVEKCIDFGSTSTKG